MHRVLEANLQSTMEKQVQTFNRGMALSFSHGKDLNLVLVCKPAELDAVLSTFYVSKSLMGTSCLVVAHQIPDRDVLKVKFIDVK